VHEIACGERPLLVRAVSRLPLILIPLAALDEPAAIERNRIEVVDGDTVRIDGERLRISDGLPQRSSRPAARLNASGVSGQQIHFVPSSNATHDP
jgi:hypothetical protein